MVRKLALVVLLLMLSVSAFAQVSAVPQLMNFQGRLARPDGTPVADGNYSVRFSLWDALSAGTLLWNQDSANVSVRSGIFTVPLNFSIGYQNGNNLANVFGNALITPYLEVKVGNGAPLIPRQPFSSVAYSLYAGTAFTVPDSSITLNKLAGDVLSFSNLSGNLSLAQIPDGLITGSKIAIGTIASINFTTDLQAILSKLSVVSGLQTLSLQGAAITRPEPRSVAVQGNYAYVVSYTSNSLQMFDVGNPTSPFIIKNVPTGIGPIFVALQGSFAYVLNDNNFLQVFDLSNPANPLQRGSVGVIAQPRSVAVRGNYAYVFAGGQHSLQVFDVSNPDAPILSGNIDTLGQPNFIAFQNNYAYVLTGAAFLQIFDVSDPINPGLISTTGTGGSLGVAVQGNYAYCLGSDSLRVFDLSDIFYPIFIGSTSIVNARSMAVQGSSAYVLTNNSLHIFNLTNPTNPGFSGSVSIVNPVAVAAQNNYAYVIKSDRALQVFGTIVPTLLQVNGNFSVTGNVGIGNINPAYPLDVTGDINARGNVRSNGIVLSSDSRYKMNIHTFPNALDTILNLRGVTFEWNRDDWKEKNFPDGQQIGFIAQEVEKILPALVSTDQEGYKSVAYANVVPVLVEAVQTQQKQIETLKKYNKSLKAENAELKAVLADVLRRLEKVEANDRR